MQTGKSKGEISKLLSILDLSPDLQKQAREDESGRITKRHLYALSKLGAPDQQTLLERIRKNNLTAVDTEAAVAQLQDKPDVPKKRGAPVKTLRYFTSGATVTVTFRRSAVTATDVLTALEEAGKQIEQDSAGTGLTIRRNLT